MKSKVSKVEKNEKKHFDVNADKYDKNYHYFEPFTKYKIRKKVLELVQMIKQNYGSSSIKILEVGCGTGEYTKHIAKLLPNAKVTGLDISPKMVKLARNKCRKFKNTLFLTRSAYETHLRSHSFDVICGFYVLHHLEPRELAKESFRVLKKGGHVFFYEPNILNPVVYLVKSNVFIKKIVGDSPDEWGINPIKITSVMKQFIPVKIVTSEFIIPFSKLPLSFSIFMDKLTSNFRYIPFFKYLGGSVLVVFRRK